MIQRKEYRRSVFQQTVMAKIFGPNREEERGDWRQLHNEELHGLYCSPFIMQAIK
jgi:hypothetical protein